MKYLKTYKLFELFDTDKTYDYQYIGVNKSKLLKYKDNVGYIYKYKFISDDGSDYYVDIIFDKPDEFISVSFSDKKRHLMNKVFKGALKDQFTGKNEPLNILNTVIKICRDFYNQYSNEIKHFGISCFTKKRMKVYLYIFKKFFNGWNIGEIKNDGDDLYSVVISKIDNKEFIREGISFWYDASDVLDSIACYLEYDVPEMEGFIEVLYDVPDDSSYVDFSFFFLVSTPEESFEKFYNYLKMNRLKIKNTLFFGRTEIIVNISKYKLKKLIAPAKVYDDMKKYNL